MKTKGIYFLYRVLQVLALPAVCTYFLVRSVRSPAYFTSLGQRLGFLPRSFKQTAPGAVWLHAVSVGEVLSAVELVRRLRGEFPRAPVFVSAATLAGRATAREKLAGLATGVFYAPIDHVFAVRRVLRTLCPAVVAILETEIWPNLFREAKHAGCGLVLLNGRISDRTDQRYRGQRWFFREVMRWPDTVLVQSETMRERYVAMGAPADKVKIGGNLKYDVVPRELDRESPLRRFVERLRAGQVWIAASTMPPARAGDVDEDDAVIAAFRTLAEQHPRLLLILAPRKPERFGIVASKLTEAGVRHVRRSELAGPLQLPAVLLLDSIGELSGLFAMADVVFMGGTLAERGGHNILEPAFFSRPILCGPHMENFREIAGEFRARAAIVEIADPSELAGAIGRLLADGTRARQLGHRALACAESKRGATERALEVIRRVAGASWPCVRPHLVALGFLGPLSLVWQWVGERRRRRQSSYRRRLHAGVISVGNITMGGTGKTPTVVYLTTQLQRAGRRPGILTRGYGRHSLERHLILGPGAQVKSGQTGDEPQIFLRSGTAPVGIGAERFETGRRLEERFHTDVLLLDDGFQHVGLERDVDIVLIDALAPFGNGRVFPLGRLREPLPALSRADMFIITRDQFSRGTCDLERQLRRYNSRAPVFRARSVPACWVEAATGRCVPVAQFPFSRVGAFCGLGNPESFWLMLESLGLKLATAVAFGDHHRYQARELRGLAHQFAGFKAQAAVTTEKDAINLCDGGIELFAPLPVYWLKIQIEIDREAEFLGWIEKRLGASPRVFTAGGSDTSPQ